MHDFKSVTEKSRNTGGKSAKARADANKYFIEEKEKKKS